MYKDVSGHYPWQAAFELLYTWLYGDGSHQYFGEKSRIVKRLKKSDKMQRYVNAAIKNYKAGQAFTEGTGEFTASEDGYELYLSTQHFSYSISVERKTRNIGFWIFKRLQEQYCAHVYVYD